MFYKYERTSSSAFLRNFIRPFDIEGIQARGSLHGGDDETHRHKHQRISHSAHQQQMVRHRIGKNDE